MQGKTSVSGVARLRHRPFYPLIVELRPASSEREEARRGSRFQSTVGVKSIDAARCIVGMSSGFLEAQHRHEARVTAFKKRTPMRAGTAREELTEAGLQRRPSGHIVLGLRIDVTESQPFDEQGIKLRLQRPDRNVPPVGA